MAPFLDALCDGKIEALIVRGTPPPDEVLVAWDGILDDYYDLTGDVFNSEIFQVEKEITRLGNHLFLLQYCIDFLYGRWSDSVANSLNKLGYRFKPDTQVPEDYRQQLDDIVARSRTKFIHLKQMQNERDRLRANQKSGRPPREYFEQLLANIEEMQRTSYNMDTLMVTKFVTLEKKYRRYVEALSKKPAK
jgi:cell fate (sporulation/competence/biofilm development) regulator YlbF (YheA/YmcA/DUF963 family)